MASVTMGALWDTGDMEKASIYSVASEKGDAGAARADAAKRAGGARCGAGEARRATRIGAKGTLRTVDARVKIGLLVAYSVALFCTENLLGLGVAAALLAAVASVGDVPVARLLREGAFAYPIVGFLLVYNVAASGWLAGIAVALRLLLLVWASLLLTALSTPAELSEALRRLLSPLGCLGLPVRDFTMSLSIALRFMPLLSEELRAVRAAQASRGAAFEGAGLVRRLRAYGGLMVPLFVGLFRRADRLASAMERAAGASGIPTSLDGRRFAFSDGAASSSALSPAPSLRLFPRSLRQGRCRPRRLSECCAT
ncbi:MAG: energy-coupling factor transporter transmembrane component T family protein [Adlercreutzia equolifaciens]